MPLASRTLKSNVGGGRWPRRVRWWGFTTEQNNSGLRIEEGRGGPLSNLQCIRIRPNGIYKRPQKGFSERA